MGKATPLFEEFRQWVTEEEVKARRPDRKTQTQSSNSNEAGAQEDPGGEAPRH
jgi:hypothetical protein